jgi:hypothetical protein
MFNVFHFQEILLAGKLARVGLSLLTLQHLLTYPVMSDPEIQEPATLSTGPRNMSLDRAKIKKVPTDNGKFQLGTGGRI